MKLHTILNEAGGLRLQRNSPKVKTKLANARQQQMNVANQFNTNPPVEQQPQQPQRPEGITAANAMEKIPALMRAHSKNQEFIKAIVHTVATAVSSGSDVWGSAQQQMIDQKNQRKNGTRGGKRTEAERANKLLVDLSNFSPETKRTIQPAIDQALQSSGTRQRTSEAVQSQQQPQAQQQQQQPQAQQQQQQPRRPQQQQGRPGRVAAPPSLTTEQQQAILAQIKAAVQGMTKEQRNVLKARVQQATLLKSEVPDPNKLMQHGQPVVNQAGVKAPGPVGRATNSIRKFFTGT